MSTDPQDTEIEDEAFDTSIAIVGMACRFPGANSVRQFWQNLLEGHEAVVQYEDQELRDAGVPEHLIGHSNYVKSGAPLDKMAWFDAGFFKFSQREASVLDPQHRHFLEVAWEAFEDAGHMPDTFEGSVGIFAGSGHNAYMPYNLLPNRELMESMGFFLVRHTGNDKDFLTTRLSYLLDLKGPSLNIQTACSTSLVATHAACQSLLANECDMAIAGGCTIELPHRHGYLYQDGEILSPDGHCRPFSADAKGTFFGSGVGLVVLRRLSDAIAEDDHIYAVIKGSAINNDGASKVGYLAPSVEGQARAVAEALAVADVAASSIGYIEAHGTGTPVGDPIEVAALTQAFREDTDAKGFCGIGSVKGNIGHLDTAAGVASLIKAAMSVKQGEIPPSLHAGEPNPGCDFATSPFTVVKQRKSYANGSEPRRAGVNSLGVGGTNAHVIVEEPPVRAASDEPRRGHQLLCLSAVTTTSVERYADRLADHFTPDTPSSSFADAAFSLIQGRKAFPARATVVAATPEQARARLSERQTWQAQQTLNSPQVAMMFAGGGAQYPGMGHALYQSEPTYRDVVDRALKYYEQDSDGDLRALLDGSAGDAESQLQRPPLTLPALLITQIAQARLWQSWGVEAQAMIGHSMGEYAAAHLAGVFSLEDAVALVRLRGRLFEKVSGTMLSVAMAEDALAPLLGSGLSLAAVNAPGLCVASGDEQAIAELRKTLEQREVECRRIRINVAAHSHLLDPILGEFRDFVAGIDLSAPEQRFVSNVSGDWITKEQATNAQYWVDHLRQTVRFEAGLEKILSSGPHLLIEVGPGRTLAALAQQHTAYSSEHRAITSLPHPSDAAENPSDAFMLAAMGHAWEAGVQPDWAAFYAQERRLRIPLPTYAFDHQRHWVEPPSADAEPVTAPQASLDKIADASQWFYQPAWQPAALKHRGDARAETQHRILAFADSSGVVEKALSSGGEGTTVPQTIYVRHGDAFSTSAEAITLDPGDPEQWQSLWQEVDQRWGTPDQIVYGWSAEALSDDPLSPATVEQELLLNFYAPLLLAQSLGSCDLETSDSDPISFVALTRQMQQLPGDGASSPTRATLIGPAKVMSREYGELAGCLVDLGSPCTAEAEHLAAELAQRRRGPNTRAEQVVAWRNGSRFAEHLVASPLERADVPVFRKDGCYLITGGLGGIGLTFARHLASNYSAKIVLVSRNTDTNQARTALAELETLGGAAIAVSADVSDEEAMRAAVDQATAQFGEIHGVLHAAGTISDGIIQLKDVEDAASVLAPKVAGSLVLGRIFAPGSLELLAMCSSVSSFSGLAGQVDYAAANAFIDAFAHYRQRQGDNAIAINWSAWQEVGMASRIASELGLSSGLRQVEDLFPEQDGYGAAEQPFDRRRADAERTTLIRRVRSEHWEISEHRLVDSQTMILPGTGLIELLLLSQPGQAVSLSEVEFIAPFAVQPDDARDLQLDLANDGRFSCASGDLECARGRIAKATDAAPGTIDIGALQSRMSEQPDWAKPAQAGQMAFGPRWQCITAAWSDDKEALFELAVTDPSDFNTHGWHPALLDMALANGVFLIPDWQPGSQLYVPAAIETLVTYGQLPQRLFSHVRLVHATGPSATFDVTLFDDNGAPVLAAKGFTLMRIDDLTSFRSAVEDAAQIGKPKNRAANNILELGLRAGLRPSEGIDVLERVCAYAGRVPQWIVSPQNIGALLEALDQQSTPGASEAAGPTRDVARVAEELGKHPAVAEAVVREFPDTAGQLRLVAYIVYDPDQDATVSEIRRYLRKHVDEDLVPQQYIELDQLPRDAGGRIRQASLTNPFRSTTRVAPRTSTEKNIAAIWGELLGNDDVGIHDNFFDIGGHSLLSIRLLSRLERDIGARLEHEHVVVSTLAQLAARCDDQLGIVHDGQGDQPTAPAPQPAKPTERPTDRAGGLLRALKRSVFGK